MDTYCGKQKRDLTLANALYDSIEDNNYSGVKYLLTEKDTDPNVILPNIGISPFHLAIGNDSLVFANKVVQLILQNRGNPDVQTKDGLTPLHIAAAWGRLEIIELLLKFGANPQLRDTNYLLPLHYAIEYEYMEVAKVLHTALCQDLDDKPDEENYNYIFNLEKVIVNDGLKEAEYEVTSEEQQPINKLEILPQAQPNEYVEDWCKKHAVETTISDPIKSPFVNTNRRVVRPNVVEHISLKYESSLKYKLRKLQSECLKGVEIPKTTDSASNAPEKSPESGIATMPSTSQDSNIVIANPNLNKNCLNDTSSDYFTSNEISGCSVVLPKSTECSNKTFEVHDDLKRGSVNIAEVYKYSDKMEGIELLEKRLIVNQQCTSISSKSQVQSLSSKLSSLPNCIDYDTDSLRRELIAYEYNCGPITATTKRLYLKKLHQLRKQQPKPELNNNTNSKVYSLELEKTLSNPNWTTNLSKYKELEDVLLDEFNNPDPNRRWREGLNKSSFTYLLLDPRVTNNLPNRTELSFLDTWKAFISSIFYVGKGKRSRPYFHLYEATTLWKTKQSTATNKKLNHILSIWRDNHGVVCLHVFQNIIPVEAYTREAAMICALKLDNIKNKKSGEFYGTASMWTSHQQKMLGVLLLYKAMLIFLNEGERQIRPVDIN